MITISACGSKPATSDAPPQQQSVLSMLVSDAKGSLQKVADKASTAQSVTVKMDGKVAAETVKGGGVVLYGKDPKAELSMETAGVKTTIRMIGAVIYISVPEKQRAEMGGKRWMKMDLGAAGGPAGAAITKQMDNLDPVRQVKTLLAADQVTVVGEETVDGVKTVHYTVTNPLPTYLGQLDADARKAAEKELAKQGIKDVKTDVWVDEKYQPRRVHVTMGSVTDLTVDYTDYGKTTTIEAPPAAEVFDLAEMLAGLKPGG